MRTRNPQAGNVLLLTGLALTVLMGFAGLAVDMGMLRYDKRLEQTAADAAAVAGANNIGFGDVVARGQGGASVNGFTDGSGNTFSSCTGAAIGTVCVQIDSPPVDGPHAGVAGCSPAASCYVEARVAKIWPTYFMNLLGISKEEMIARAVATSVSGGLTGGGGCVYTIGAPAKGIGININGSATLNATSCGIVDNGNFSTKGNALNVNAYSFGVSGSWTDSGTSTSDVTCASGQTSCPQTSAPAGPDPMAGLTPPAVGTAGTFNPSNPQPGTYNGVSLASNLTVNFAPGIYVWTGNFSCSGTDTITGTGVMFYFTNGATFNCQGNDNINLTAPTSSNCPACPSQYDGILMYQDPADTSGPSIGGNVGSQYNGMLYFPTADVTFYGNSSTDLCSNSSQVTSVGEIVANTLNFSGNPTICMEGALGLQNKGVTVSTVTTAILVE